MAYVSVDVEVDMDDFDTDDLIDELRWRGHTVYKNNLSVKSSPSDDLCDLVNDIYQKRRTGVNFDSEIDNLIYNVIGRM